MQSWCRTWPPNGPSRIRAKQKLLRKHKGACKNSWSQIGSLKSFTLTVSWNLAKLVKIFPGIIVRQHLTDRKLMGLPRERCADSRKAPLQYCCNLVCMKNGGRIPWNVTAICETFKISCLMLRHLCERRFGQPFERTNFSIWCNGRTSPYFCQRPVATPSVRQESLP